MPSKTLPWRCDKHPNAKIREVTEQTYVVLNGYPAGQGFGKRVWYECSICGKRLADDKE